MKILLDGYFDRNFGDDLMLLLAAEGLKEHEVFTDKTRRADVYLKAIGSGFLIHNKLGVLYRFRDMQREKKYAPQRAVINCNISPFINSAAEKVIKKQLSYYDLVTVRDRFSYNYLRTNLPEIKTELYPDMVLSLPESMIPDTACENLLGIAVHNSADCNGFAAVADGYIGKTGRNVLLLCFDSGAENDAHAAVNIRECMRYRKKAEIVTYEKIPDMLAHMKRCSCIAGVRYHSSILAARMGIAFVPFGYSAKTENALREIGYDKKIYNAADFDVSEVLNRTLTEEPFMISKEIITLSSQHLIRFKEYIKRQS